MHSEASVNVRMETEVYRNILHSITGFTLAVQLYVTWLVQCKSPQSMREYRFFLNLFTLYDMLFTIALGVGLQPESVSGKLASWCRGVAATFGPQAELYVLGLTIFFGSNMIIAQDYCLIYRFTAISDNPKYHRVFMSIYFKIGWFIFAQAISIYLGVFIYKICYQPDEFQRYIQAKEPDLRDIVYPNKFIMWVNLEQTLTFVYMGSMLVLFLISEIVCITLIRLILSSLKEKVESFSRNTYNLHKQLTILLAFQLATPLILVLVPLSAALIFAFLGMYSNQLIGQVGFIVIEMYGVTNALFTLLFVKPYRHYTYNKLIRPWFQPLVKVNPLTAGQLTSSVATASTLETSLAPRTIQRQQAMLNVRRPPSNRGPFQQALGRRASAFR